MPDLCWAPSSLCGVHLRMLSGSPLVFTRECFEECQWTVLQIFSSWIWSKLTILLSLLFCWCGHWAAGDSCRPARWMPSRAHLKLDSTRSILGRALVAGQCVCFLWGKGRRSLQDLLTKVHRRVLRLHRSGQQGTKQYSVSCQHSCCYGPRWTGSEPELRCQCWQWVLWPPAAPAGKARNVVDNIV